MHIDSHSWDINTVEINKLKFYASKNPMKESGLF